MYSILVIPSIETLLATPSSDLDNKSDLGKLALEWNQHAITNTVTDVLLILDCCYALSTAVENTAGPQIREIDGKLVEVAILFNPLAFVESIKRRSLGSARRLPIYR
ncbi:uncharacterized protein BP5553_00679 [Venustampulla echinocandica]|uniref:Uncharacterized protein n=1 Tax=Venustampulla echinocandica TaxID=2656787 RepID=A0A370TYV8_9HELO|nr:uncharacterized protein BP5553_00679 [Venustampulla echinocandica]RDL40700.1 hypothetical protein BP5553_00679 [Venustampulla echinocandica]